MSWLQIELRCNWGDVIAALILMIAACLLVGVLSYGEGIAHEKWCNRPVLIEYREP